jgi:L-alanine-DL-glutamate epimerase-like enolase superfamily enzyme
MAVAHLCAAVPNVGHLEYHALDVPWWDDLLDRTEPVIEDGTIAVPEAPGYGVELDDDVAREHATAWSDGFFEEDGS